MLYHAYDDHILLNQLKNLSSLSWPGVESLDFWKWSVSFFSNVEKPFQHNLFVQTIKTGWNLIVVWHLWSKNKSMMQAAQKMTHLTFKEKTNNTSGNYQTKERILLIFIKRFMQRMQARVKIIQQNNNNSTAIYFHENNINGNYTFIFQWYNLIKHPLKHQNMLKIRKHSHWCICQTLWFISQLECIWVIHWTGYPAVASTMLTTVREYFIS